MAFKLAFDYGDGNGTVTTTNISNAKVITGNNSGKVGGISQVDDSGVLRVTLSLDEGNMFDWNPDYGSTTSTEIIFSSNPIKNYEFYVFWHNYQNSQNTSSIFNNGYHEVKFPGGYSTLNNATSGLIDGMTQVFKFTTTVNASGSGVFGTPPDFYGTLYMRNCR